MTPPATCNEKRRREQCEQCKRCKRIAWMLLNDNYSARRFQALLVSELDPSLYRSMAVRN